MYKSITIDGRPIQRAICDGRIVWEKPKKLFFKGSGIVTMLFKTDKSINIAMSLVPAGPAPAEPLVKNVKIDGMTYPEITVVPDGERIALILPTSASYITKGQTYEIEIE